MPPLPSSGQWVVPILSGSHGLTSVLSVNNLTVCAGVREHVCAWDCYVTVMMWHTGASVSTLSVTAENLWMGEGLLDDGISCWEETAEACVASAVANQHSVHHRASTYARHHASLLRPLNNPPPLFFWPPDQRGQKPTKGPGPQKSKRGGLARREGDKGTLKCSVKAACAAESSQTAA